MSMKPKVYEAVPTKEVKFVGPDELIPTKKGPWFGKRHLLTLTLLLVYETTHSVKVYMTICIIAMTDHTTNSNKDVPTYNWTNTGVILTSFAWGLCLSQMLGGWIVSKYQGKRPLMFTVAICSIMGFLIPTAAKYTGSTGVTICRIIQGVSMGPVLPFVFYLYGKWIPPAERSRLVGLAASGATIGVVVSMYLSGILAASRYGWPLVIYFYSGVCMIWCIIFGFVAYDTPAEHPTISNEERTYIESSLLQVENKNLKPPYKQIFTSVRVWACIISRIGGVFGYNMILIEISSYLRDILHINITSNGLISAVPYFCALFLMYSFGFVSDFLLEKRICSRTLVRKIMFFFGSVVPSIFLLVLAHCKSGETIKVIVLLTLIVSFETAGGIQSLHINSLDLAPNYSGTIEGLSSQIAMLAASVGPLLVQFIVSEKRTANEWKIVFYIVAAVKGVTAAIFLIFGTAETQPWNDQTQTERSEKLKLESQHA